MRYLKSYQLFESVDNNELNELNDLVLNLRDNNFIVQLSFLNEGIIIISSSELFKYSDIDDDIEMITNYLEKEGYRCSVKVKYYGEKEQILYPTLLDNDFECIQYVTIIFDKLYRK